MAPLPWLRERRTELVKFGTVGGIAFVVDLGLFNLLHFGPHPVLGDKVVTAKVVSAAAATVVAWIGNRLWTFRERRTTRPVDELLVFGAINLVALLIPVATVAITTYAFGLDHPLAANAAAIFGIGIGTITRYVGYRRLVFTDSETLHARIILAVSAAPERIVLVVISLALAAGVTVSLGAFHPWTALPLAIVLAIVGWRLTPPRTADGATTRASGYLMAGALVWVGANMPWVAEYLIVRRDPGFLTLGGLWLVHHGSTDLPLDGAGTVAYSFEPASTDQRDAWTSSEDVVQPQGAKMLPALIAVGGWLGGTPGVLTANLVIGAVGLLAVYVLAREFMGPRASLVPALAVGLTVAHMTFSRAAYTEPITMILLVMGIAWAWRGLKERSAGPIILAAVVTGAATFARIDGAAYALGLLFGVAIAVLGTSTAALAWRARTTMAFALVQGVVVAGGYASLHRWSRAYYNRLDSEAGLLGKGYAATVVIVVVVALCCAVVAATRTTTRREPPQSRSPVTLPRVAAGVVIAGFVVLATRPLWGISHGSANPPYVEWLQERAGVPIDGTRTYAEATVTWLSLYVTWPVVILGAAGFAVAAWRWARGDRGWIIPVAGFLTPTLLYLVRPAVVPDQTWAVRRIYGSGIVGLIVLACVAWRALIPWIRRRRPGLSSRASWIIGCFLAGAPVLTWLVWAPGVAAVPLLPTSALYVVEQGGARAELATLCAYVDGRPVILVGTGSHFGGIRIMCDVPVVYVDAVVTQEALADMSAAWGRDSIVVTQRVDHVPWVTDPTRATFHGTATYAGGALLTLPVDMQSEDFTWYVGEVQQDGLAVFVAGPPPS